MRRCMALAVLCLAACASEKLAQAPPVDVDFSGHWKLNEADSDDPQRLLQAQFNQAASAQNDPSSGGSGGRGGRQGGGRGGGSMPAAGPGGPIMPSMGALGEGLRWPGKVLEIKQVAGVVAFTSGGASRVCQPMDAAARPHRRHNSSNDRDGAASGGTRRLGRAMPRRHDVVGPRRL